MATYKTNFLFPVETINRELDFQLLLAVMHATKSRRMIIARSGIIHALIPFLGGGIYIGKDIAPLHPQTSVRHDVAKAHGFRIVHLDEEGGFYAGPPDRWRQTLDARIETSHFRADDFICTWGDFQRDYLREKSPEIAEKILTTGHPRFDLCKKKYREYWRDDVAQIHAQYGNYLLINTSFSTAIYQDHSGTVFHEKAGYIPGCAEKRNWVVQKMEAIHANAHVFRRNGPSALRLIS